jgi:hypothetical protein
VACSASSTKLAVQAPLLFAGTVWPSSFFFGGIYEKEARHAASGPGAAVGHCQVTVTTQYSFIGFNKFAEVCVGIAGVAFRGDT